MRKNRPFSSELLEARIAPAAILGLDKNNHLLQLDSAAPELIQKTLPITGLAAGEQIVAIDFAPDSGYLFGLGITDGPNADDTAARLYQIDPITGAASPTGLDPFATALPDGAAWSIDFDPHTNILHAVNSSDQHFTVNPGTGALLAQGAIDDPNRGERIVSVAFDQNVAGAPASTLYGIDLENNALVRIGTSNGGGDTGAVTPIGGLGLTLAQGPAGFDVSATGEVFASLIDSTTGTLGLYRIDLGTGAATRLGTIGFGGQLLDLAAVAFSWTGFGENDNWSNPSNWTAGIAPSAGDSLLFSLVTPRLDPFNDLPADTPFHSIRFTDQYFILHGNEIVLTNGIFGSGSSSDSYNGLELPVKLGQSQTFFSALGELDTSTKSKIDLNGYTLTLDGPGDFFIGSQIVDSAGGGTLVKTGAGTAELYGNDTFTGQTLVKAGTMSFLRDHSSSPVVLQGGTVSGEQAVEQGMRNLGQLTAQSGTIRPGDHAVGLLSTGDVILNDGVIFNPTLKVTQGATVTGSLFVQGSVTLNNATLQLDIPTPLLDGARIILVANDGSDAVNGTFASLPEGATVTVGGVDYQITYQGNDGNDIVLSRGDFLTVTELNSHAVTFTDVDGDLVTVKVTRGDLTPSHFHLQPAGTLGGVQVERLILTSEFNGTDVTITAKPQRLSDGKMHGDGFVNIGSIEAAGNLGKIMIDGDLGHLEAGSGTGTAVKSLTVETLGRYDVSTQNGQPNVRSVLHGGLGVLVVKHDISAASLLVDGGTSTPALGKIGSISIGGFLSGSVGLNSGTIISTGDIGNVKIGGSVLGFRGEGSGGIHSGGSLGKVTVAGSLVGGAGKNSGGIFSITNAKSVSLTGGIAGGEGERSGLVEIGGILDSLTLGGSLKGGAGGQSGQVFAAELKTGVIGGSIIGGAGSDSGVVNPNDLTRSLLVKGSILGGAGQYSGTVYTQNSNKSVTVYGSVVGGDGIDSGEILAEGNLNNVVIYGDVTGGSAGHSGQVVGERSLGKVLLYGSLVGGADSFSGSIRSETGGIGSVTIYGSVEGRGGISSGVIEAMQDISSISITGSVSGGAAFFSGAIRSFSGAIGSIRIGGDLIGGQMSGAGELHAVGSLRSVYIAGDLIGGSGPNSAAISGKSIDAVTIGGTMQGGSAVRAGSIGAGDRIGAVTIGAMEGGSFKGAGVITAGSIGSIKVLHDIAGAEEDVVFSATATGIGQRNAVAIEKVEIGGSALGLKILAGYIENSALDHNASLGTIRIHGEALGINIVAGAIAGPDGLFGTSDDQAINGPGLARIAALIVDGVVRGSRPVVDATDHFGIVADEIVSLKIKNQAIALTPGPNNDTAGLELGNTGDFTVRELNPIV